jgi:alpha-tubulin suppressor-like RCC1 family protein
MLACEQIVDMDTGFAHVVAIASSGDVYAWGNNLEFQCGLGVNHPLVHSAVTLPVRIPRLIGRKGVAVSCGMAHTLLLTSTGEIFVWGAGSEGQLGLGTYQPTFAFRKDVAL